MAEKTLNLPLNGAEIRAAITDRLARKLKQDCYLHDHVAYEYVDAKVTISIKLHNIGQISPVEIEETIQGGEEPVDDQFLEQHESTFDIKDEVPNETRVETGQGVPTLTKDSNGKPEIQNVRYKRADAKKAAKS